MSGKELRLSLLGSPEVYLDHEPVNGFRSGKARALFYYLVVTGQLHQRPTLARLLWGGVDETYARRSLNQALSNLRRFLSDYLVIERESVVFKEPNSYWLDSAVFEQGVSRLSEPGQVEETIKLYRGDFLDGFYVQDAPEFEQWVLVERARLRELALRALNWLVNYYQTEHDWERAIRHARHVLGFEPWREETHRQLMLMMAQSGQRSAALAQYEICQRILAEELAIEPDAATTELANQIRVGGIERVEPAQSKRPSRLEGHTAGHSQTQSSAPSSENLVTSRGLTAPSHNLPTPSTSFIGRSEEVVEICRLLREEPECRLLSLIGSGGIGKTRLAIEVASGLKEEFDDGVYFVGLAAVSEPILIVSAIADVLGLTFSGRQDPKIQLLAYLRERHLLIVVDNFEHLLDGAELLADIVTSAPNVQLLVTSRERLNLQEEWNFTLQGMGFPQRIEEHDSVSGYPAIQLFLQRARQAETMFNPTDDEINHIGRICQLVGGAPLGIELAAAWVSTLSCHEIAQEIEQSLDFLTTSLQNVPERHRSIRAVLAQTWQRLAADEQEVMRKLSLFQGGFTYDVAKEITGVSLPMLVRLADKSLLRRSGESIRSGRYNMHDLIQRFAQEKLAEQPAEAEPVQHQFCCYFADRLQALEPDLLNERQGQVYIWIRQEIHNIQASWDYALQEEPVDVVDQFIESLGNYYAINARYHQGLHFTAQAVQRLRSVPQRDRSVDIALSKALNFQSIFQITLHDLATAEKDLHESVALSRQSEAMEHLVPALGWLALVAGRQQQFDRMRELAQEALELARTARFSLLEARMLSHLADAASGLSDYEEAERLLTPALRIYREHQHHFYIDLTLGKLADVTRCSGDFARAKELVQKGINDYIDNCRSYVNWRHR